MTDLNNTASAIDTALELAANAKAKKNNTAPTDSTGEKVSKRPRLSDEEKAARQAARDEERATKKAARAEKKFEKDATREAEKAERKAAREAKKAAKLAQPKKIPHLAKLEKNTVLPEISDELRALVEEVADLSAPEISAVIAHVQKAYRAKMIAASNDAKVEVGDTVKIVSGSADVLGCVGTVAKAQRIRAYVSVPGFEKPIYVFTAELEKVSVGDTVSEDVTAEAV